MTKQHGSIFIYFLLVIILVATIATILWLTTLSQNSQQNPSLSFSMTSSPSPEPSKRTIYNFPKIWNKGKEAFEDKGRGLLFYYPKVAKTYNILPSTETAKLYEFNETFVVDLVSQSQTGTELYDGMSISLAFTENSNFLSLNQLVEKVTSSQDTDLTRLLSSKSVSLNGYPAHEIIIDGWGGGSTSYYLLNKKGDYFIKFDVIAVGPDKDKFKHLSEEILNTIQLP